MTIRKLLSALAMLMLLMFGAYAEELCQHAQLEQRVVQTDACQGFEIVETVCTECGAVLSQNQNEIPQTHAFSEWVLISEATCQSAESWQRTCADCGLSETENRGEADPACHAQTQERVVQTDTCQGFEIVETVCTECGAVLSQNQNEIPQTHAFSEWVLVSEATCQSAESWQRSCADCGLSETENRGEADPACHAQTQERVVQTDTCQGYEIVETVCTECGAVLSQNQNEIPQTHAFSEWVLVSEATCQSAESWQRVCADCGLEETESRGEVAEHAFGEMLLLEEPTCTGEGLGVMACGVCGQQQEITVAMLMHQPMEQLIRKPTAEKDGEMEIVCERCGETLGVETVPYTNFLYNNTITSLGPCTRDLIGGNDWYRLTPIDLKLEGTLTYPLIATNRFSIGTMTAVISDDALTVSYAFDTKSIRVNSETLIIYENLDEVQNPHGLRFFDVGEPISIKKNFGEKERVILSLIIRADYDAASAGVSLFWEDETQMQMMTDEITGIE